MSLEPVVIPEKIYFKIGEVCELVGVQAHVLRYWETEFPMLSPQKNKSGQRSYRRRDVEIALKIKTLLYNEMFTIAGARKKLQTDQRSGNKAKQAPDVSPEARATQADPTPAPVSVPPSSGTQTAERPARKPTEAPTLFEGVFDTPANEPSPTTESATAQSAKLKGSERDVLHAIAAHLLELREMLSSPRSFTGSSEK
jgi:DNA-binding transcriptional MerR regulator